jgi:hypothetical protein
VELPAEDVLRGMYPAMGCRTVERVPLATVPTLDMWVDEDGLCAGTPPLNQVATFIAHAFATELVANVVDHARTPVFSP